jgi:hypothetical protein
MVQWGYTDREGHSMDAETIAVLNQIYAAVDYVSNLEGQDPSLVIEMSQQMISDAMENGALGPMVEYIARYCDVTDSPEDTQRIADDI